MAGIKGRTYLWSAQWISVPSAKGAYLIRNKEGAVLHVGKGNVRERLLSHWNRESPANGKSGGHAGPPLRAILMTNRGL